MSTHKPLVLLILDGWGYDESERFNAIAQAKTPYWTSWWKNYPHTLLSCSGESVGLPPHQMGNSEVGHMHIGAGRVIEQDFTRINQAIETGLFMQNPLLKQIITDTNFSHTKNTSNTKKNTNNAKNFHTSLHILGLLSPGGVHSHENHLFAFLRLCQKMDFKQVYLHLFLDGRDTPPRSALESLQKLNAVLQDNPVAQIASIAGRYYAMDRDGRWERIAQVYELLTSGKSEFNFPTAEAAIHSFYEKNLSDEFIPPTVIGLGKKIVAGDSVFFFNYRADRARQLTQAFIDPQFTGFQRPHPLTLRHFVTMTQYAKNFYSEVVFPPLTLKNTLAEVLSTRGLKQLRVAETEKYAHVTFFLNGGVEISYPQEDRILIPSVKVPTYDLQPEMSAPEITTALIDAINKEQYDVIICNFANADMVGHTGNLKATMQAVECLDQCMGKIYEAVNKKKGVLLITADHGNAETMYNPLIQQAHTAHTSQPVPFVFIGSGWAFKQMEGGSLVDIAPTLLALLNIPKPPEMTGSVLLEKR